MLIIKTYVFLLLLKVFSIKSNVVLFIDYQINWFCKNLEFYIILNLNVFLVK